MPSKINPETVERLIASPQAQRMIAELDADAEHTLDARRAAAVAAIADVKAAGEQEQPRLRAEVEQRERAVRAAGLALNAAKLAHGQAAAKSFGADHERAQVIDEAKAVLQETVPDAVAEFLRWAAATDDSVRQNGVTSSPWSVGNPNYGERVTRYVLTDQPSRRRYLVALRAAREEVLRLVVTVASRAAIAARIAELRAGLPALSEERVELPGAIRPSDRV